MKKNVFIGLMLGILIIGSLSKAQTEQGFLEGRVTMGPTCPVEVENVTEECELPAIGRRVAIYIEYRESTTAEIYTDENGSYSMALDPGTYVVDVDRFGTELIKGVPREVEIKPGETVELDIFIDTGVRGVEGKPTGEPSPTTTIPITSKGESSTSILILAVVIIIVIIILVLRKGFSK